MAIKNITDIDALKSLSTTVGGSYGTDNQTASIYMDTTGGKGLSGNFSGYARNIIKSNGTNTIHIGDNTSLISRILIDAGSTGTNGYISLNTKQVERMRIHSGGNVSIGTTNAYAKLSVYASSHNNGIAVNRQADTTAALYIGNDGGNNPVLAANNADMLFGKDVSSTFTEYMRLTTSGTLKFAGSTNGGELYADNFGLKVGTSSGYIQFGPANTSWAHIYTDRPAFYFNKELYVNNAQVATRSWVTGQGYLTSVPSHQHTDADINSWHNRETVNIDTYNPDSNWSTSIATSTSYGTQPNNYTNIHNLGGDGVDFQTQIATYYGNNNRMWVRSRYDGTNAWLSWNEVWTSGSFANNSANWNTAFGWGNHATAGYLTGYTETQTLDDVTSLGNTTSNNIAVGPSFHVGQNISTATAYVQLGNGRTGSGYAYIDLVGDTTYGDYGLRILRGNGGANTWSEITHRGTGTFGIGTNEAAPLQFKTSNTERMRIDSSGNVGIGTTSPSYKLDVYGSARIGGSNGDVDLVIEADADNSGENDNPRIVLKQDGGLVNGFIGLNGDANAQLTGLAGNSMYIQNTGYPVHIAAGTTLGLTVETNGNVIIPNGNVGIGTTSPSTALDVNGILTSGVISQNSTLQTANTYANLILDSAVSSNDDTNLLFARAGSLVWDLYNNDINDSINFNTKKAGGAGNVVSILQNGNVGIGTTGPAQKLDVRGNATFGDGSGVTNIYADNAYTLAGFDAPTFTYSYAGGDLLANPATGQITWQGSAFLSGNVTPGVIPQGATLGLADTGLQDNYNGPSGYGSLLGSGISYRDPLQPFAPAGYPDIGTSAAIGGFVTYGSITSHTGAGSQDGAAFGSPMGIGDVALFEGPATFTYRYGSGVLTVDPVGMQFAAFDYLGGGGEMRFDPNAGALFAPSFSPTSDKKLKDNIAPINNGLDVVTKLNGKEYDWKSNGKKSSGFIAQEVEEVIPHAVTANSNTLTLNYNAIIAYQNEAIKELKGMIDDLKQEIEILKNK